MDPRSLRLECLRIASNISTLPERVIEIAGKFEAYANEAAAVLRDEKGRFAKADVHTPSGVTVGPGFLHTALDQMHAANTFTGNLSSMDSAHYANTPAGHQKLADALKERAQRVAAAASDASAQALAMLSDQPQPSKSFLDRVADRFPFGEGRRK